MAMTARGLTLCLLSFKHDESEITVRERLLHYITGHHASRRINDLL